MFSRKPNCLQYCLNLFLILSLVLSTSSCAAIIRGTTQTCHVVTDPPGQTVVYNGREVNDGETITVQKHFDPALIHAGDDNRHVFVELKYDPDPLLFCDAALLPLGVVPGLVALGVDLGTGAWRDLHNPQVVYISTSVAASRSPDSEPPPWAPTHGVRGKYRYHYYPSASVYLDLDRQVYFYRSDGHWLETRTLPAGIYFDRHSYAVLEMGTPRPYTFHASIIKRHPPGQIRKLAKRNGKGKKVK